MNGKRHQWRARGPWEWRLAARYILFGEWERRRAPLDAFLGAILAEVDVPPSKANDAGSYHMNGKSYRLRNKATPAEEAQPAEDAAAPKAAISNTGSNNPNPSATPPKRSKSGPTSNAVPPDTKS